MDDWDDEDMVVGLGNFLNPLPLSRRGIRRDRRHLGSSDLHEIMSIMAYAADDLYISPDEGDDDDHRGNQTPASTTSTTIKSLLDLTSRAVAKNCTCDVLEQHQPPLDEALLRKVAFWAFPQDEKQVKAFANLTDKFNCWERGCSFVRDKRIREMWQVGFMATAYLSKYAISTSTSASSTIDSSGSGSDSAGGSSDIRVSLTFEQQKIVSSTCSECKNDVWCSHIIAAIIFRIKHPSQVRVHAPMTETLSSLDRNQLQKLLQYAVNEDPAGVLGKVFKHVDAVRDCSSQISVVAGAPDPTFGRTNDCLSQWQLSLQWLKKTLKGELDEMTRQRIYEYTSSSAYYPDSYDWSEKIDSRMYSYLGKVLDLARQGESAYAGEVLITIMNTVLQRMDTVSKYDCPCLSRFGHDLIHIFTILLLDPKIDKQAHRKLEAAAKKFQGRRVLLDHYLPPSDWAELPTLYKRYELHSKKVENNLMKNAEDHKKLFVEPLAALYVPSWPPALQQLMDGEENSDYDEDLILMLVRLETLFHLENNEAFPKIGRLCSKIIGKLAQAAQKYSVLGQYLSDEIDLLHVLRHGHQASDQTTQDVPPPAYAAATSSAAAATPEVHVPVGKGKSKRRRSSKGKQPAAKRAKLSQKATVTKGEAEQEETDDSPIPRGQLVFSLLYSLQMLQVAQKVSRTEFLCPRLVSGACLLALELSRFRTVAKKDVIKLSEHNWLLKLENMVCEYLKAHPRHVAPALNLYLDAFLRKGFPDNMVPLVLIEMILDLSKTEALRTSVGEKRRDDIVQLCANVLLDSHNMLDRFTLPTSSPFDIFIDTITDGSGERRRHRDFAVRKVRVITETLFSLANMETTMHVNLLSQVLCALSKVGSPALLKLVSKDVRIQVAKLEQVPDLLQATLRFAIHAYKKTENLYLLRYSTESRQAEREFILSLARKLGVGCLPLFCENWEGTFSCGDIRELLLLLEPQIRACPRQPKDVGTLLLQYYDATEYHGENACDLLVFCRPGDKQYIQYKTRILKQPQQYHINALLELAKRHLEQKKSQTMDKETFGIVEAALGNLQAQKKELNPATYELLDWVFTVCTSGGRRDATHIAAKTWFKALLQAVKKHSSSTPEVLLRLLHNMEQINGLLKQASAPLAEALVASYQNYFDVRYSECTHAAYASIINEMHRARLHCKQYLKAGDRQFDENVVDFIKRIHSGKKKLLKMLSQEFGSKS